MIRPLSLALACIVFATPVYAEVEMPEAELSEGLRRHIAALADGIGTRGVHAPEAYQRAADYINHQFKELGYEPARQVYEVDRVQCANIEVERKGSSKPDKIIIIGAHYDTVRGTGGANDNSSGVAAMLMIADMLKRFSPAITVRFVAFANEEPPYFQTSRMGSVIYAKRCSQRGENIVGMLSLETIGFYSDEPNSQRYPDPFAKLYPSTGNFIGFVGNVESKEFLESFAALFRKICMVPLQSAAVPDMFPGVGWSDHWAFWQEKFPAIMVTDTAPFRYPHYHLSSDTPDKLDYDRMTRVVNGLAGAIREFASEKL